MHRDELVLQRFEGRVEQIGVGGDGAVRGAGGVEAADGPGHDEVAAVDVGGDAAGEAEGDDGAGTDAGQQQGADRGLGALASDAAAYQRHRPPVRHPLDCAGDP